MIKWRHRNRGGLYQIVGTAIVQTEKELKDGQEVYVYKGEDGRLWCRTPAEFMDGRFEKLGK